ncbi:isoprenylcysteine carboxylmethyltransferase family protein [candidate division WWE3 bacterium]|uniref:Isoprenylcysteine carboxylmethyltransferase family protein n=1 Tax=candidate division WWE3 bacterium TaxID=2053526 RepID=A0A955RX68_UNCKA|nr:isoprenylcysteine carboxylmethyltransferase family protein [candidate division WWE3 bacterium]
MQLKYSQIKLLVSAILSVAVSFLLVINIYQIGPSWFIRTSGCARITLGLIGIIWITFTAIWSAGRWTSRKSEKDSAGHTPIAEDGQDYRRALPEGVIYWLLATTFIVILRGIGDLDLSGVDKCVWQVLGLFCCFAGFAFALWARLTLGKRWHRDVQAPDSFIQSGPYALVRHPIYSGEILMALGTSLWSTNIIASIIMFGGMITFNTIRCRAEE